MAFELVRGITSETLDRQARQLHQCNDAKAIWSYQQDTKLEQCAVTTWEEDVHRAIRRQHKSRGDCVTPSFTHVQQGRGEGDTNEREIQARDRFLDCVISLCGESISVAIAPIFGFFGRVGSSWLYSAFLLVTVILYVGLGAFVFGKLETGENYRKLMADRMLRKEVLQYFTMDPHEGYLVNDTLTNSTIRLLLTESDWNTMYEMYKGRCFKADARDAKYHFWNFWSSMDFASTILTTIGYGGMVPRTGIGKLVVVLYALPGMLLMMSYLNMFALCILIIIRKILKLIEKIWKRISGNRTRRLTKFTTSVILAVVSLLMLIAYLVIMAFLLSNSNENDTFIKSLYFYTITMTTVGLGDIAVIDHLWWGVTVKVLCVFCIGLALVTTVFGAFRGLAAANKKRVVKATRRLAEKAKNVQNLKERLKGPSALNEAELADQHEQCQLLAEL